MHIGTVLRNRYKILKLLGSGGFGDTYLAVDIDLPGSPKCVVKHLKAQKSNPTVLQIAKRLFDQEAKVLYRLSKGHSQIPQLFGHFEENNEFYLVQEYIDGHDLTKEIKSRKQMGEAAVAKLLQEILEVLTFVHEQNVIHRDIKLRNIMRRRNDGKIVLIDFGAVKEIKGLATTYDGEVNSTLVIGTPGYMPSEQANGKPRLCSDVYAVGMIGIQALTGKPPRGLPLDPSSGEVMWLQEVNVSHKMAQVLTNMVRCNFSQRYQTAGEALQALLSPMPAPPQHLLANTEREVRRQMPLENLSYPQVVKVVGLLGLLGAGLGLTFFGASLLPKNNASSNGTNKVEKTDSKPKTSPSASPVQSSNPKPQPSPEGIEKKVEVNPFNSSNPLSFPPLTNPNEQIRVSPAQPPINPSDYEKRFDLPTSNPSQSVSPGRPFSVGGDPRQSTDTNEGKEGQDSTNIESPLKPSTPANSPLFNGFDIDSENASPSVSPPTKTQKSSTETPKASPENKAKDDGDKPPESPQTPAIEEETKPKSESKNESKNDSSATSENNKGLPDSSATPSVESKNKPLPGSATLPNLEGNANQLSTPLLPPALEGKVDVYKIYTQPVIVPTDPSNGSKVIIQKPEPSPSKPPSSSASTPEDLDDLSLKNFSSWIEK
ncbi:MAG: protein kinase [Mastigocoleus sp. MO_167.B18]|uniref:serine/threonine protein kinase n=1 Tax=Mastigocoleus sp. MO_188.B34 TaxID=3036635 RepID=UPI00262E6F95|nr:serine/threonine protein kinase [Mastigocoleus sp. MO_188.B34]MDJ0693734.1 protein kinase [Mastigocoleus sp. MO_188.B34]MDJ0774346.1 protein kinase [Mastigocoleus sp. MO_167.B18]